MASSTLAADSGKVIYESKCFGCHSPAVNRVGPRHEGVYGRKIAGLKDYNYSQALKRAGDGGQIWNDESLDRWLKDPRTFAPGTYMANRVTDAETRKQLILYLKSL